MQEVTAARAAALTGLSERTIRRKIASGELPARRIAPNRFAIQVSDLPIGRANAALVARVDELEQRVQALEQRAAGNGRGDEREVERGASAGAPASQPAAIAPALQDLLAQLVREAERLAPAMRPDLIGGALSDAALSDAEAASASFKHAESESQRKREKRRKQVG